MKKETLNESIKGIIVILFYVVTCLTNLNIEILNLFNINYDKWGLVPRCTYLIIYQVVVCIVITLIMKNTFKPNFIDFKNNFKSYMAKYIKYWFLSLGGMMISNIIIQLIRSGIAPNEQVVQSTIQAIPLYAFIAVVIIAPFLEEAVFRLSIRKLISKNNWLFILVSGLIFGSIHVVGNVTIWSDWLFIVPYSIPGLVLAYTLVKSNNIFVPISLHLIHNGFLTTIQLLTML